MRTRNLFFLTAVAVAALLSFATVNAAFALSTNAWLTSAADYEKTSAAAKKEEKPFILFFHVDWCDYCVQLKKELLDDAKVERFLSSYSLVKINPEDGSKEDKISTQYKVDGYPDFRIVFPDGSSKMIEPFKEDGKMLSPDEFITLLAKELAKKS